MREMVLYKYNVTYYKCSYCEFIQTEEPYWLNEAYQTPINIYDTGVVQRNIQAKNIASSLIYFLFDKNEKYLDYAGGYGLFVRLMRDAGYNFYWQDIYTQNLFARGFEAHSEKQQFEFITAFEVFEHFVDPIKEIEKMLTFSENILFSTSLIPIPTPKGNEWVYYGLEHGQHVSLYSEKTLNIIAKKFNGRVLSYNNSIHLFTKKNFNEKIFKSLCVFSQYGLSFLINKSLNGKTLSDQKFLMEK